MRVIHCICICAIMRVIKKNFVTYQKESRIFGMSIDLIDINWRLSTWFMSRLVKLKLNLVLTSRSDFTDISAICEYSKRNYITLHSHVKIILALIFFCSWFTVAFIMFIWRAFHILCFTRKHVHAHTCIYLLIIWLRHVPIHFISFRIYFSLKSRRP